MYGCRPIPGGEGVCPHLIVYLDVFPAENVHYINPVATQGLLATQTCPGHPIESGLDERGSCIYDCRLISGGDGVCPHLLVYLDVFPAANVR